MNALINPDWIAVDWGTTNLRAWAMGANGPLAHATSQDGMGKLTKQEFEPALLRLIAPWLEASPVPVIACGMVGSRQGWCEAPYRSTPCTPLERAALITVPTLDPRLRMMIAPGLKQTNPADVMRGEETQIAGALSQLPGFDGVFCLPGTHSKWVHISGGEVIRFQTFLTGELFALLAKHSILRHSVSANGWDDAAFDSAVSDAISHPEKIAANLFTLRAGSLIAGLSPDAARARLSGLLIGTELGAIKPFWHDQHVVLIGAEKLSAAYGQALLAQGISTTRLDATDCTLTGLATACAQLQSAAQ